MIGAIFILLGAILCTPTLYLSIFDFIVNCMQRVISIFNSNEQINDFVTGNNQKMEFFK